MQGYQGILIIFRNFASKHQIKQLPIWYTYHLPIHFEKVPCYSITTAKKQDFVLQNQTKNLITEECDWLDFVSDNLETPGPSNITCSAYHAAKCQPEQRKPCITNLLPLMKEKSSDCSTIRHGMGMIKKTTNLLTLVKFLL